MCYIKDRRRHDIQMLNHRLYWLNASSIIESNECSVSYHSQTKRAVAPRNVACTNLPEASQAAISYLTRRLIQWHRCWRLACKQQLDAQSLPIIHLPSLHSHPVAVTSDPIVCSYVEVRQYQRGQLVVMLMAMKRSRVRTERARHAKTWSLQRHMAHRQPYLFDPVSCTCTDGWLPVRDILEQLGPAKH